MKSYPIWNVVKNLTYKGNKSYGVKETGEVQVLVGTSASNSHHFLTHKTTHEVHENGDRTYRFWIEVPRLLRTYEHCKSYPAGEKILIATATLKKGETKLTQQFFCFDQEAYLNTSLIQYEEDMRS